MTEALAALRLPRMAEVLGPVPVVTATSDIVSEDEELPKFEAVSLITYQ